MCRSNSNSLWDIADYKVNPKYSKLAHVSQLLHDLLLSTTWDSVINSLGWSAISFDPVLFQQQIHSGAIPLDITPNMPLISCCFLYCWQIGLDEFSSRKKTFSTPLLLVWTTGKFVWKFANHISQFVTFTSKTIGMMMSSGLDEKEGVENGLLSWETCLLVWTQERHHLF